MKKFILIACLLAFSLPVKANTYYDRQSSPAFKFFNIYGNYENAVQKMTDNISDNPLDSETAYFYRSCAYEGLNNITLAIKDMDMVIKMKPSVDAYGWRAYLYARSNDPANIEKMYDDIANSVKIENKLLIPKTMMYLRLIMDDYKISGVMRDKLFTNLISVLEQAAPTGEMGKEMNECLIMPIKVRYLQFLDQLDTSDELFKDKIQGNYINNVITTMFRDNLTNDKRYSLEEKNAVYYTLLGLACGSKTEGGQELMRKGKAELLTIREKSGEPEARKAEALLQKIQKATQEELYENYYQYSADARIEYSGNYPIITVYFTNSHNRPIHKEILLEVDGENVVGMPVYKIYQRLYGREGTLFNITIKKGKGTETITYTRVQQ